VSTERRPDFDARARSYEALRPADESWWATFEHLVELGDLRGRRVLDVGCGTGRLAAALRDRARAKVWGIDSSDEMVAVARESLPGQIRIRRGVAERLPFRDGWFDRVTMALVIHLLGREQAFAEARRVVGTDGRIAISTFHPEHFESYWLNPYFPSIRAIDEQRFPTPETMQRELERAGFPDYADRLLVTEESVDRDDALARIRGRHISTFDLLTGEEIDEGTARAELELPETVTQRHVRMVVVGRTR
jgi:ubiquinone/menaquinone biosynthesis C-methylase UbiE